MSKRSNKRAKKITDEALFGSDLVQLEQTKKIQQADDDDIFYEAPSRATANKGGPKLSAKEIARREALVKTLFATPAPAQGATKKTTTTKNTSKPTVIKQLKPKKTNIKRREQMAELAKQRAEQLAAAAEEEDNNNDQSDEDDSDNENSQTLGATGLTKAIDFEQFKKKQVVYINKKGKIYTTYKTEAELAKSKNTDQIVKKSDKTKDQEDAEKAGYRVAMTDAAVAKSLMTGKHYDYLDLDRENMDDEIDLWDNDTIQKNAEDKTVAKQRRLGNIQLLESSLTHKDDEKQILEVLMKGKMKNRRSAKTSKHVTQKALRVAPSGLSINPVQEDMDMLIDVYKRRLTQEQKKKARLDRQLEGDINIHMPHGVSSKERAKMAKMYAPIPREPTLIKIKTKTERNQEKKKAKARFDHAMLRKNKKFNDSIDKIRTILKGVKKHESFVKDKLPQVRAEAAAIRDALPKQFGKSRYKTPLSIIDLQTPAKLESSQGKLRTTFMSTNLLADSFGQIQRANMIPAKQVGGKKAKRREYKMKSARAAGVRLEETDVDAIVQRAQERAKMQPHPVVPSKNTKRKFDQVLAIDKKANKKNKNKKDAPQDPTFDYEDGYDNFNDISHYGVDADDLWG